MLTRCDVTLSAQAKRTFQADQDVAGVPATWIAQVDDSTVRLRKAAEELLPRKTPDPPSRRKTAAPPASPASSGERQEDARRRALGEGEPPG